jgi:YVTN family beta-propeller protein
MKPTLVLLSVSVTLAAAAAAAAADSGTLKLEGRIALPGVRGRFDHFAIDTNGHRLFVAALGNNTLEIIDTATNKRLKSIPKLHKPTGVLFLAEPNQIAVANGDDGTLKVFDGNTLELVKTVGSLDDADNVRLDAVKKQIYLGYGDGALAVIDATTIKQTGSIKLPAHPESFQLEIRGPRIFVNVPGAKAVAVIDRDKGNIVATWPMKEFQANFPMALDEANQRLFVGCRSPARLVVIDTSNGKAVANLPISGDTDDLFYHAAPKRIYLSCGEGYVDVVDQSDADHYQFREKMPTRAGARTSFFITGPDKFFLAVPRRANKEAEINLFQALNH